MRDPDDWWWIFDPRQSLRARAVLVFGGLALAFTLLLGWSSGTIFRRQLSRQLGPAFETLAFQIGDKLDRSLDERLRALQLGAALAPLKNPSTPVAERRAVLDTLLNAAPDCAWIGFADRDGRIVCATSQLFEGTSVANTAWFRTGSHAPYAGNVHEFADLASESPNSAEEKPRFLDLAVPVNDARGKPLGVLGAHLRWSWARDTQHSVVSDAARREHIGVTIYAPGGEVLLDSGASGWTLPPDAPAIAAKAGAHGYFLENVPGDADFFTGYSRTKGYREFHGVNWLVIVRQPVAEAFAPARELRRWIWWLGGTFTVAIAVLGWVFAGRFARRLVAVASAADRIRDGDILTLMPRPRGRDEIGTMCAALGAMVDDFRQPPGKPEPPRESKK
jgi:HAMP domain-containing protein